MKYLALFSILLCVGCLVHGESPIADIVDGIIESSRKLFVGPLGPIYDKALKLFKVDDWKAKIDELLSQKARELSERGQREFEKEMNRLNVLKSNPSATKEEYMEIFQEMKEKSEEI